MEIIKTNIEDVLILKPKVFGDKRGYFMESFSEREFCSQVREIRFVQDNESCSVRNVVRGLHFQKPPFSQSKLVRVVKGKVLDVSVLDEVVTVGDEEAFEIAREMGKTEGFLIGISSGAALSAAIKIAKREENKDKNIVVILADSGDRYLSTSLYNS